MLSLETIGFYSDEEGSQRYPWPLGLLYPGKGDFVVNRRGIGTPAGG